MTNRTWLRGIPRAFPLGMAAICCLAPALASAASLWTITAPVDNAANLGQYVSLAVDGNKKMHISYFDTTNNRLKYTTDKSGNWQTTPTSVVGSNVIGAGTAIAIDPTSNNPHIAYYYSNTSNRGIRVAYYNGSSWTTGVNPDGTFTPTGASSSALYNRARVSHLVYSNGGGLYYTKNTSAGNYGTGGWSAPATLDATTGGLVNASVVSNAAGKVFVVAYSSTTNHLYYYTNESGSWVGPTVLADTNLTDGRWCSLAIDPQGNLHASYLATNTSPSASYKVKYLYKPAGGAWQSPVDVGDAGAQGGYSSIAADNGGSAHVSYYYYTGSGNGKLVYASNLGGSWVSEDVDTSGNNGNYSKIAVDSDQNVYIAYYDASNSALRAATKKSLIATPASQIFGAVDRGFESNSSPVISIKNNLMVSQNLGSIALAGNNPGDFVITDDGCSGLQLAPQNSCTVQLYFAPPAGAPRSSARSAVLNITPTAPFTATLGLALSGSTTANYLVTATAGNGGSISPPRAAVAPGGSQSFSVTTDAGFSVKDVILDGTTPMTAPYTLSSVAADHSIQASLVSPIRILDNTNFYGSLQAAYGAANSGWTIQSQASIPAGDLLVDRNVTVNLFGGYDSNFTQQNDMTQLPGNLTISDGTLTVENLTLQ